VNGTGVDVSQSLPWYAPTGATLLAILVTGLGAVLTARWNRRHQLTDRHTDRAEHKAHEAKACLDAKAREQRVANRAAWTTHYERIDKLTVEAGRLVYVAQRQRLHHGGPEAAELVRLQETAEQYAAFAPGGLPAALGELARAAEEVHRHLLPAEAELQNVGPETARGGGYRPILTTAGEQTRASDRLASALAAARIALHHEWGPACGESELHVRVGEAGVVPDTVHHRSREK
jgi:hypothetical protein